MSILKELYIEEMERIAFDAIDNGASEAEAWAYAEEAAYPAAQDRIADIADRLRQQEKDARDA